MKSRGFALTELVVILAIMGILMTIATINYNNWSRKYAIEAQVKELHSDITSVRLRAIATKLTHRVTLNPNTLSISFLNDAGVQTTLPGYPKNLKYPIVQFSSGALSAFSNTDVDFNERGYLSDLGLTIAVGIGLGDAALNCLAIHTARVNMGRINGNSCDLQ